MAAIEARLDAKRAAASRCVASWRRLRRPRSPRTARVPTPEVRSSIPATSSATTCSSTFRSTSPGTTARSLDIARALVGMVAERTLLPGRAIPAFGAQPAAARRARRGGEARSISTAASSSSTTGDGAAGRRRSETVKVRNDDSGVTVSGAFSRTAPSGGRRMMRALLALALLSAPSAPAPGAPCASRTSRRCAARATTSSSATAWSSACRAPATPCATRRSPSSRCNPCSTAWASTCTATRCATATSPRSSSPPICRPAADAGSRLDVTVSSLGDATSLMGGTLLLTQLSARTDRPAPARRAPSP